MDTLTSVGLRLKYARKELRKMTQPQLATAAGIKQPSLSELETGETKEISGPVLISLSKALRVRPEWVVTGELPIEPVVAPMRSDESDLLESYRGASGRWKSAILYMAKLRGDQVQDEAAESMTVIFAKISATPATDRRVEETYGSPPSHRDGSNDKSHRFRGRDGESPTGQSGKKTKKDSGRE